MQKWLNSSRKNKIIAGVSIDYAGSLVSIIVSFVVVPFFFRYITKEEYGIWLAINGVIAMVGLVEIGVDTYLTTKIADTTVFYSEKITGIISNAFVVKAVIAGLFLLIGVVVYNYLPSFVSGFSITRGAYLAYMIAMTGIISGIFMSTITTVLTGRNHLSLVNSFSVFFSTAASILSVILLSLNVGLASFPLSALMCSTVNYLILLIMMRRKYPHIRLNFKTISFAYIKDLFNYTKSFQLLRILYVIRTQYIVLVITKLVGPAGVTQYNITNRIPQMIPAYVSRGATAIFPSLAEFFAEGNLEKVRGIYLRMSKVILRMAFLSGILVYFCNEPFIALWVGKDKFAGSTISLLLILYMAVSIVMSSIGTIVYAKGEFRKWPLLSVVEVTAAIILSYVFYRYFGFVGIVSGFLFSSLITSLYLYVLVNHILKVNMPDFLRSIAFYALFPNVCTLAVGIYCRRIYPIDNWWALLITPAVMMAVHLFSLEGIRFVFSKETTFRGKLSDALKV